MSFRFKLFKVLTGISLFITGFFLLANFLSMFAGAFTQGLVTIIMVSGIFVHAVLSASLQRSLQEPGFPLKESTPLGIRIMSGFTILMGFFFMVTVMNIPQLKDAFMERIEHDLTKAQQMEVKSIEGLIDNMILALQIFFVLYASIIITNAFLSLSFLQEWIKKQEDNKNSDIDLDLDA